MVIASGLTKLHLEDYWKWDNEYYFLEYLVITFQINEKMVFSNILGQLWWYVLKDMYRVLDCILEEAVGNWKINKSGSRPLICGERLILICYYDCSISKSLWQPNIYHLIRIYKIFISMECIKYIGYGREEHRRLQK